MEATTERTESKTTFDPYALIRDKITAKLEQGIVPWHMLWDVSGPPRNLISKEPYKGISAILLGMEEYEHNWFLTFDEVNGIGGKVKKDTRGHTACRWVKAGRKEGQEEDTFFMKTYTVFNVAQCDIPVHHLAVLKEKTTHLNCDSIVASMRNPPKMQIAEAHAFYDVVEDTAYMPRTKGRKKDMVYYAAAFRQLVHSTGHDSRLARKGVAEMSELADHYLYSQEDLVGEIGLCFLLSTVGVHTRLNSIQGYAQGLIAKLKEDKRLIVIAANHAQKAVDYILNTTPHKGANA